MAEEEVGASTVVTELASDDDIEDCIAAGARSLDAGDLEPAATHYQLALSALGAEMGPRRAEVHCCLAEIEQHQGRPRDSLIHLEKALAAFPSHEGALRRALKLSEELNLPAKTAGYRSMLLEFQLDAAEREEQLRLLSEDGLAIAIQALESYRSLRPKNRQLLDRLRATYEATFNFHRSVDVMVALAEGVPEPLERARTLVEAAEFCARRAGDSARAVALYEAAIADDPAVRGAFEAIEGVLVKREDWRELEKAYVRQCDRLAKAGANQAWSTLLGLLADLRHDRLEDRAGAIDALSERVSIEPQNVDARLSLANLLEKDNQLERAIRVLETAAWHDPNRADVYHSMVRLFSKTSDHDSAFHASAALVHLGEAEIDEQLIYQQYRPETGLRPVHTLDDQAWAELYPLEHDANVRAILLAIGPAAMSLQIEQMRAADRLPVLDGEPTQDPETSTVSVVRTVGWAAQMLHVPLPDVYVQPEAPIGIAASAGLRPTLVLGKTVLTGRSVADLAFLVGRDLTYFRPEHSVLMYYPTMVDLNALVMAALRLAMPNVSIPKAQRERAERLAGQLERMLSDQVRQEIQKCVTRFQASGNRIDLRGYVRSLEIAATRAGLLLSGDLPTAGRILASDVREVAGLKAADRMRDLLPYSASPQYRTLRSSLGVAAE